MNWLRIERTSTRLAIVLLVVASIAGVGQFEIVKGTSKEAEFLSAATKTIHVGVRNKKSHDDSPSKGNSISTNDKTTSQSDKLSLAERQRGNGSVTNQMTTALSQLDLGLGYYKMCPFPFSYLHQCENSSECPGSDCCGMYAFPGPSRWQRSCCVPSSVTTIARVARLCIKSEKRPSVTGKFKDHLVDVHTA